ACNFIQPVISIYTSFMYLATRYTLTNLHYSYRQSVTSVARIIRRVCQTLWRKLVNVCLPLPSEEDWKEMSDNFQSYANFPN
ncbi:hypothetical protein Cfor_04399, partial [Coptotermes formosanus]